MNNMSRQKLLLVLVIVLCLLVVFAIHVGHIVINRKTSSSSSSRRSTKEGAVPQQEAEETETTERETDDQELAISKKETEQPVRSTKRKSRTSELDTSSKILIDLLPPKKSFISSVMHPVSASSTSSTVGSQLVKTIQNGMQPKFLVRNIGVRRNEFFWLSSTSSSKKEGTTLPSRIYFPDGQLGPMKQNHKYTGHKIRQKQASSCKYRVTRPTIFLYRMSGHSTYHLWENNLGPFFQTLHDFKDQFPSSSSLALNSDLFDPKQLLIVFTDNKPRNGPKSPHLLDQLLRTFSDTPLINASRILDFAQLEEEEQDGNDSSSSTSSLVCFDKAILGISANSYRMRPLVEKMKENLLLQLQNHHHKNKKKKEEKDTSPPPPLSDVEPRCVYISRNHPSITRGRQIANEKDFLEALNRTLVETKNVRRGVEKVFMEEMSYAEQVELAASVDIMFSPHGGGVANCIWMNPGSVMVEFVAPVGKTLPNMYHSMCSRSGISHFSFLADPDPRDELEEKKRDLVFQSNKRLFSNMVVPVEKIEANAAKAVDVWLKNRKKK